MKGAKEIRVIIGGKEYICRPVEEIETTDKRPRTGYERVEKNQKYYFSDTYNSFLWKSEDKDDIDERLYYSGNYYNDKQLTKDIARADTLMRRMRQWQALNDNAVGWHQKKLNYCIQFDYAKKRFAIAVHYECRDFGKIYFSSEEKALEALDIFRDDLMWYFTEYRQRLDEPPYIPEGSNA